MSPAVSAWILLMLAIVLEVSGTLCMRLSEGFQRLWPSLGVLVFYGACFTLLTLALRTLSLSVAYAVWAGLGTALVAIAGIAFFGESMSLSKLASLGLIVAGVVGLHLSGGAK